MSARENKVPEKLIVEISSRLQSTQVWRNGAFVVNWARVQQPDEDDSASLAMASSLMAQIYTAALESQKTLTEQLVQQNTDVAMYMWYEAAATCHAEIRKAIEASREVVSSSGLQQSFQTSEEAHREKRMKDVFDVPSNENSEAIQNWIAEFNEKSQLLFDACVKGDAEVVRYLLASNTELYPEADPSNVPLHAACFNGNIECAKMIHNAGIDTNRPDEFRGTPLMRAAVGGKSDVVRWLLENGADATLRESREGDYNALEYGAGESTETTRMLLDKGCPATPVALAAAASHANEESFDLLWSRSSYSATQLENDENDLSKALPSPSRKVALMQPLSVAGAGGSIHIVKRLLEYEIAQEQADPSSAQELRPVFTEALQDAATGAATKDHIEVLELLIDTALERLDNSFKDEFINRILATSAESGSSACAKTLLDKYKANINYLSPPQFASPLYHAVRTNRIDMVRLLIADYQADVHQSAGRFANGPTALWLAINQQNEPLVRELLRLGGPVEHRDPEITTESRRVFISAAKSYRAPVRLHASLDPLWDMKGNDERFLCLEFPDGFWIEVQQRRSDEELKDERELKAAPAEDLFTRTTGLVRRATNSWFT